VELTKSEEEKYNEN